MKKLLFLLIFLSNVSWSMNYVKVAENENMIIYVDVDSIKKTGNVIKLKEVVDFKKPHINKDGIEYSSHLIEQTINCLTREQTLDFITIYTGLMLQGSILEKGIVPNSKRVIPETSLSYQTFKFVCSK